VRVGGTASTSFTDSPISETTPYTYTVDAYDAAGNVSPLSAPLVATAPDDQPPTPPSALKLNKGTTSITASWAASSDNVGVTGYRLYRNGIALTTTTAKTYTDPAVVQGSSYSYQVVALDKAGNQSASSATQSTVFPDTTKPTAPTKLTLTAGTKSITLKWVAATDNVGVTAYRIYRATTFIGTVASPALTYTNSGLKTGTAYSFHVVALDAAGNASAASATVSAKAR
jgi:chitodextrinase